MTNNLGRYKIGKIPVQLIIIGFIGLLLLIIGNPFAVDEEEVKKSEEETLPQMEGNVTIDSEKTRYKKEWENNLAKMLSKVEGIGEVSVLLQLEGGQKLELAREQESDSTKTKETDAGGGTRIIEEEMTSEAYKMIREGGENKPLVLRKLKPEISGVLIVAEGANNVKTQKMLIDAVESLLDVPSHKVSILTQNGN